MTQREALEILKTGANVFLTGEPGSGKSYVVGSYVEWLRARGLEPAVTAATGIAAAQISGMTVHSWSGIGVRERLSAAEVDQIASKEHVARRVARTSTLVVDEVSMLSAALLEALDAVCKEIRRSERPFGGLQLVLVGDFFQLPPVLRRSSGGGERQSLFCYDSAAWRELNPLICYLGEQHRQEDREYLEVLSAIRRGEVEELHYERINARRIEPGQAPRLGEAPRLYSHNADVDRENAAELAKLPGAPRAFLMSARGAPALVEGLKRGCLSPERLELKEGAAVMFTKNSPTGRYVNGTLGRVIGFDAAGLPIVEMRSPSPGSVRPAPYIAEPVEWQVEENGNVRAAISQLPLRLAYAMTVHKSQGQSLDAALVDLSRAFEYGQGYVALSRVRTLAGLHLAGINERALLVHPEVLERDRDFRAASSAAAETFEAMGAPERETLQKNFVKASGGEWNARAAPAPARRGGAAARRQAMEAKLAQTLERVRAAPSLAEAARTRGLAESTILTHLEKLAAAGALSREDFSHLLPAAGDLAKIRLALKAKGGEKLAPAFYALKGRYPYEVIRLARLGYDGADA
ncbi:MAG TPA: AAA family ATPase [Candidatus Paceibacterota bacterium]|nr:AAA family ATPase [Candidatus Paceibacterota bacterium]